MVKRSAVEGSMLTLIGKIAYDVEKDQFSLTDSLGFVGGGFSDSFSILQDRYNRWISTANLLLLSGVGGLTLCALDTLLQRIAKAKAVSHRKKQEELILEAKLPSNQSIGKFAAECCFC